MVNRVSWSRYDSKWLFYLLSHKDTKFCKNTFIMNYHPGSSKQTLQSNYWSWGYCQFIYWGILTPSLIWTCFRPSRFLQLLGSSSVLLCYLMLGPWWQYIITSNYTSFHSNRWLLAVISCRSRITLVRALSLKQNPMTTKWNYGTHKLLSTKKTHPFFYCDCTDFLFPIFLQKYPFLNYFSLTKQVGRNMQIE